VRRRGPRRAAPRGSARTRRTAVGGSVPRPGPFPLPRRGSTRSGDPDRGRRVVADPMLPRAFDLVVVVAGAAHDPGIAALAALAELLEPGDVRVDAGEGPRLVVRGKGRVTDPSTNDAHGARVADFVRVDPGRGGPLADQRRDREVGQQVAPNLLVDEVWRPRAQDLPRPAQVGLDLLVAELVLPSATRTGRRARGRRRSRGRGCW
jgi:hypothetical protein